MGLESWKRGAAEINIRRYNTEQEQLRKQEKEKEAAQEMAVDAEIAEIPAEDFEAIENPEQKSSFQNWVEEQRNKYKGAGGKVKAALQIIALGGLVALAVEGKQVLNNEMVFNKASAKFSERMTDGNFDRARDHLNDMFDHVDDPEEMGQTIAGLDKLKALGDKEGLTDAQWEHELAKFDVE